MDKQGGGQNDSRRGGFPTDTPQAQSEPDAEAGGGTWVSGGDDGAKEQAVGEEEVPSQLSHVLHQRHAAIHEQPAGERDTEITPVHLGLGVCYASRRGVSNPARCLFYRNSFPEFFCPLTSVFLLFGA